MSTIPDDHILVRIDKLLTDRPYTGQRSKLKYLADNLSRYQTTLLDTLVTARQMEKLLLEELRRKP